MKIRAYRRPDGRIGIRNHIAIIPTTVCSSHVAVQIANQVEGAVALPHQHGCCQIGPDFEQTIRTLIGMGRNPNVAAVLVVGLGCEGVPIDRVVREIAETGKPVEAITIQECGGTLKAMAEGIRIARKMAEDASLLEREEADISELVLAIECGGSDFTSGIAANPAVGNASDRLIALGGTSILSETTELIGAEHILARRAVSPEVAADLLRIVRRCEERAKREGVDLREGQPTPGNKAGGLTTIEEKSLGCSYKAGTAPIQGVLEYAQEPKGRGFYIMDTPGQDIESNTGMLAGGAQIIVFTTGRGTPTGSPIAPVIKVTGNPKTFDRMWENIDINAGTIMEGEETIDQVGERIFNEIVAVANGKKTKAEILGHKEFGIHKLASTF